MLHIASPQVPSQLRSNSILSQHLIHSRVQGDAQQCLNLRGGRSVHVIGAHVAAERHDRLQARELLGASVCFDAQHKVNIHRSILLRTQRQNRCFDFALLTPYINLSPATAQRLELEPDPAAVRLSENFVHSS